jgi:hypothetical protein
MGDDRSPWIVTRGDGITPAGRRRHQRKPVLWRATLELPTGGLDCVAFDLSLGGAKLRLDAPVRVRQRGRLVIERYGAIAVEVAWQRPGLVGLRFLDPPWRVARLIGKALPLEHRSAGARSLW